VGVAYDCEIFDTSFYPVSLQEAHLSRHHQPLLPNHSTKKKVNATLMYNDLLFVYQVSSSVPQILTEPAGLYGKGGDYILDCYPQTHTHTLFTSPSVLYYKSIFFSAFFFLFFVYSLTKSFCTSCECEDLFECRYLSERCSKKTLETLFHSWNSECSFLLLLLLKKMIDGSHVVMSCSARSDTLVLFW